MNPRAIRLVRCMCSVLVLVVLFLSISIIGNAYVTGNHLGRLSGGLSNLKYSYSNANNYTNYYGINYYSGAAMAINDWANTLNVDINYASVPESKIRFSFMNSDAAKYSNLNAGVRFYDENIQCLNNDYYENGQWYVFPAPSTSITYAFGIVFYNQYYTQLLSNSVGFQALSAHEVGHIFSLLHPGAEHRETIMFPDPYNNYIYTNQYNIGSPVDGPTKDDATAVRNAYP